MENKQLVTITLEQANMVRTMLDAITVQGVDSARKITALDDSLRLQIEKAQGPKTGE